MNIVLCEDIPQHADYLVSMIEQYYVGSEPPIIFRYERCDRFLDEFGNRKINYDAIFLDIMMPGISGLDAARQIRLSDESIPIVFITSALEHAQEGYEYDAVSFLSKPVAEDKLFQTLSKIEKRRKAPCEPSVIVTSESYVFRIMLSNIMSIQRVGRKTVIYQTDGKCFYTNQPINDVVKDMRSRPDFFITYQADCVNLRHVTDIDKKRRTATLSDGRKVLIGRNRLQAFLEAMIDFGSEEE